jgi:hypothetical protein
MTRQTVNNRKKFLQDDKHKDQISHQKPSFSTKKIYFKLFFTFFKLFSLFLIIFFFTNFNFNGRFLIDNYYSIH